MAERIEKRKFNFISKSRIRWAFLIVGILYGIITILGDEKAIEHWVIKDEKAGSTFTMTVDDSDFN